MATVLSAANAEFWRKLGKDERAVLTRAVPAILEALARREEERRRLVADVAALKRSSGADIPARRPADVRAQLRRYWRTGTRY